MSFKWEWFDYAGDLSSDILPLTCPSASLPFPIPPRQSISLWKWHFKRLIALWPSLRASDRWLVESSVEVLCVLRLQTWELKSNTVGEDAFRFVATTWSSCRCRWDMSNLFLLVLLNQGGGGCFSACEGLELAQDCRDKRKHIHRQGTVKRQPHENS